MKPGVHYDVPEADYHADPAEIPSLSCSVARLLIETTARRAQHAHPRLSSLPGRRPATRAMEEGTILHQLLLGTPASAVLIGHPDYRTAAARTERDAALAAGQLSVLARRWPELQAIAQQARETIAGVPELAPMLGAEARSEVTMLWEEAGGVLCRSRVDRMGGGRSPMYDLKFTAKVDPLGKWDRRMVEDAFDLRSAFYRRGHRAVFGHDVPYVFVVVEIEPPADVLPLQCTPQMLELGESKAATAIDLWGQCMRTGRWDGYARRVHHVSPPGWAEMAWNDSQAMRAQPGMSRTQIPA